MRIAWIFCHRALLSAALAATVAMAGCDEDPANPTVPATFLIDVSGEQFTVRVENSDQVSAFEVRRALGNRSVVSGLLVQGDGGFNQPWSWHLDPQSVHVADFAIEFCDGRPSMVEDDLEYWLGSVGEFCPWDAKVVARVN